MKRSQSAPSPPRQRQRTASGGRTAAQTSPQPGFRASAFTYRSVTAIGATPREPPIELQPVRFGVFAPDARTVSVAGSFNDWDRAATPLRRDASGNWSVDVSLPPGEYRYRLIVDGEWRDPPCAARFVPNPFGSFDGVIEV